MAKVKRYQSAKMCVLSTLMVLAMICTGQQRQNPFEVKPRLNNLKANDTLGIKTTEKTLVQTNIPVAGLKDTIPNIVVADTAVKSSVTETKADAINPFEVDHVPQKKSSMARRSEKMKEQAEATKTSNGFIFWFLLLACGLLAIVINTKQKALGMLYRSILNENVLKLMQREESTKASTYLVLLYAIFAINLGVFAYLCSIHFGGQKGILILLLFIAGVILIYGIRHAGLSICGKIFKVEKQSSLYSFTVMLFNHFAGIMLIPANFLLAFGPSSYQTTIIWTFLIILAILLFLRTVRGIFIISEYLADRIFQIFIYLCAFEIAPVLILIKTAMNLGQ